MTIDELLAAAGLTANDEIPIWDAEATGEPTKKITVQNFAASLAALLPLIQRVEVNLGGTAITLPDSGGFYCENIDTGVTVPYGFTYLCAAANIPFSVGVNIVVAYRDNTTGHLVVSASALQSMTLPNTRKFWIYYIVQ